GHALLRLCLLQVLVYANLHSQHNGAIIMTTKPGYLLMKTQELTANGIDRAFLEKLVGEMNDLVPDDQQLEARHDAAYKSERAHKKIELQRILLREDSVHREMWRDYWKGERDYINGLFRALARDGQLPKDDVSDLLYFCDHLVKYNMRTGIRDGRPVAEPVPIFEGAFA